MKRAAGANANLCAPVTKIGIPVGVPRAHLILLVIVLIRDCVKALSGT